MTTAASAAAASATAPVPGHEDSARLADIVRAAGLQTARDLLPPAALPRPRVETRIERATLPVRPELASLLPAGGLRRGSVVSVRGSNTLLWLVLADAVRGGCWAGVVGLPDLGLLAGLDLGVPPEQLMLIPDPGSDLGTVVAALLDGVDLVVVNPHRPDAHRLDGRRRTDQRVGTGQLDPVLAQRLARRAKHRGGVILTTGPWPGADLELSVHDTTWSGLDHGAGYLTGQHLNLTVSGRGAATRPRTGQITPHQPTAAPARPKHGPLRIVGRA
jgi:hypothetical protein